MALVTAVARSLKNRSRQSTLRRWPLDRRVVDALSIAGARATNSFMRRSRSRRGRRTRRPQADTLDADVGAEPHDDPIEAAAGVRFLEPHHVADGKRNRFRIHHRARPAVRWHSRDAKVPATSAREYEGRR